MTIPFFTGSASVTADWPVLEPRLRAVASSGLFTSGAFVRRLEEQLCATTGAGHAVVVGNGTDALIMMLRAAGVGPRDEVIVPVYSFFATASSVLHVGATPVMVDIDPVSYALDPDLVAEAITPRTRAIMPVHLFSQLADLARLRTLADDCGLLLLEDSAEGIGMRMGDHHAGLWGQAGVLSFFPTKTLAALGDAGAVLTHDGELADAVRRLRCHGQRVEGSFQYEEVGYNSRCDEIQAAVVLTRLEHLDQDIARRAHLAARYDAALSTVVTTPSLSTGYKEASNQVFYVYLIESELRDELVAELTAQGVGTEIYYPRTLAEQPALLGRVIAPGPFPVAEAARSRALALPLYPDLTDEQVDRVCSVVRSVHGRPS